MHQELAAIVLAFESGVSNSRRPDDRALVEREYFAALAPMLAAAVVGRDVTDRLKAFERVLGHTWIVDPEPFREALEQWRALRERVAKP